MKQPAAFDLALTPHWFLIAAKLTFAFGYTGDFKSGSHFGEPPNLFGGGDKDPVVRFFHSCHIFTAQ